MNSTITIDILGTRGSVPVNGADYMVYGGATSCVAVRCGNTCIYLDAGSGILSAPDAHAERVAILLSHFHLDHLIGLPFFSLLFQKGKAIEIYGKSRSGHTLREALDVLLSPPFWPIGIFDFPSDVTLHGIKQEFTVGDFTVETMEGAHPGGSTVYRLSHGEKSFVYATDFEHNEIVTGELIHFAKNTDLLIYDAQYSEEEYTPHFGYGHSTPSVGIHIAEACGAKRLLFTHHSPDHTDATLAAFDEQLQKEHPFASFAKAGMQIVL